MASPGNQHCVNSIGTLSNPILPYFSSVHEMWMLLEPHRSKEQKMPANAEPRRHVVVFEMPRRSYVIKSISTGASTSTWSATSCARCRLWLWRFLPRVWSVQETIRTRSGGRGGGGILYTAALVIGQWAGRGRGVPPAAGGVCMHTAALVIGQWAERRGQWWAVNWTLGDFVSRWDQRDRLAAWRSG